MDNIDILAVMRNTATKQEVLTRERKALGYPVLELEVEVKVEHVHNGRQKQCYTCPLALALNEVPGVSFAEVQRQSIKIVRQEGDNKVQYWAWIPFDLGVEILRFDTQTPRMFRTGKYKLSFEQI